MSAFVSQAPGFGRQASALRLRLGFDWLTVKLPRISYTKYGSICWGSEKLHTDPDPLNCAGFGDDPCSEVQRSGQKRERGDVQLNLSEDFLLQTRPRCRSRIVDENIYVHAVALKLIEQKRRCGWSGQVERHCSRRDAELCLQFFGKLLQPISVASYQHRVVPIATEELGQFASDASRGAGNEGCGCGHDPPSRRREGAGMQERKIGSLSPGMPPKSSKPIHTTHRPWSYMSYWKVPRATFAADYSPASIGWPRVSFYNHSAVAMANARFCRPGPRRAPDLSSACCSGADRNNGGELCRLGLNGFSFLSMPR